LYSGNKNLEIKIIFKGIFVFRTGIGCNHMVQEAISLFFMVDWLGLKCSDIFGVAKKIVALLNIF